MTANVTDVHAFCLPCFYRCSPRVRLFDRPPAEQGSILLATACMWRVAKPASQALAAREAESLVQEEGQEALVLAENPAVELFGLLCAEGRGEADYPFVSFYESTAYDSYRKKHFLDFIMPKTLADASASQSVDVAERALVLWNALFIEA